MTALVRFHQQALSETGIIMACLALLANSCSMTMPAADGGVGSPGLEERRSSSAGASPSQGPGAELVYPAHRWGKCPYSRRPDHVASAFKA